MKKSLALPAPALLGIGLFIGIVLTVLVCAFSQQTRNSAVTTTPSPTSSEVNADQLSSFELHYVNAGNRFARIPHRFCQLDRPENNLTTYCGPEQSFQEIDLQQHNLPVERIHSAVTDGNGRIVYVVLPDKHAERGCTVPDLFVYDVTTKQHKKLKNNESMWRCGAAASALSSLSQGGHYLIVTAAGPTEAGGQWAYNIDKAQLDAELSGSRLTTIFSLGADTSGDDPYVLYVKGCSDGLVDPSGIGEQCVHSPALMLRNNTSGKTAHLTSLEQELIRKGIDLDSVTEMRYSPGTGELYFATGDIGKDLTIKSFDKEIVRLVN